jgi:glycosyltransferase involved in cell wall biosynthesis
VRDERIDVIHACESIPAFVAGLSVLWGNSARRIFNRQHNIVFGKQRLLSFLGTHMSHLIMPVSRSSAESAQKFDWAKPEKIIVSYSGIDKMRPVQQKEIREARRKLRIPDNAKVVSLVAHLREEKGHLILLEACRSITQNLSVPLHLVFAGSGDFENEIREAIAKATYVTTHLVGHQSDVALWFSVGDVVTMPSYHEAFGLSAVEAMSCGRALVASDVGGLAEIIENGKSGVLVQPRNPEALSNALLRLLTSPETANELGDNARKRVEDMFTVDTMVDSWIRCYEAVLSS